MIGEGELEGICFSLTQEIKHLDFTVPPVNYQRSETLFQTGTQLRFSANFF